MKVRQQIKKWLYTKVPGFAGSFPYFKTKVFFPKNSWIFQLACEQGIYESENLRLISALITPNSVYFDVGANIGLMSIPILHNHPSCKVVSFEPSPNTLSYLQRTAQESIFGDRWQIIGKAAGSNIGNLEFYAAVPELGALDGFKDTNRAGTTRKVTVPVTTIDAEWESLGNPKVSLIKIDVEGAEIQTIQGALNCIKTEQPYLLIEWNSVNLKAYEYPSEKLIDLANEINYMIFSWC